MSKKSFSRVEAEAKENLDTIKNDVPENKLQTTQQVADTESALDTKPTESSFTAKKSKVKGATLKQETIADAITGSSGTAGMGINAAGRGVSGTSGGVLGANNSTPVAGKSRADSRVGKKLDRLATKLNYTPCEQVIVELDESKPLADSSEVDQGYNGTYRNESARSQKIMGAVPGDLMFQRSVDLITKDKLYFVDGQQVFQTSDDREDMNPTKSAFNEVDDQVHDVEYTTGNFLHRDFRFGIGIDGKCKYFFSDVDDLTPESPVDPEIANVSSAHRLIKSNVAEIDRQVMDTKAGDEKADIWTPLARAIHEPTATSYFLAALEGITGAYVHLAYSKGTTNMAYQLNRAAKDGLSEVRPAVEECIGYRVTADNSLDATADYESLNDVFNRDDYAKGDPTLMIAAYDSVNKYRNKADLLLQPRGWRMHFQTADNNMNPLKVPSEYANVFVGQETYSTIDHEYDPTLPICMTDKANLITTHNINEIAGFFNAENLKITYSSKGIAADYRYSNVELVPRGIVSALGYNKLYVLYKTTGGELSFSSGVVSFDTESTNRTNAIIDIIISETDSVDGYTKIAEAAFDDEYGIMLHVPVTQDGGVGHTRVDSIVTNIDSVTEFYYNGAGPFSYKYSDLRNFYTVDVKLPLIEGLKEYLNNSIGGKFYDLLIGKDENNVVLNTAELFIPLVFSTQYMTLAQLIICAATPWIVRTRINSMRDVIYYEDNVGQYPFSKLASLKDVPFKNYLNFGYSSYDEPLQTKVMNPAVAMQWIMPEFFWKVGSGKYVLPWYFNENEFSVGGVNKDASAMSFPSIRSGIRLGALDIFYGLSEKDVRLGLDRLTKYILQPKFDAEHVSAIKAYKYGRNTDGQPYVEFSNADYFSCYDVMSCPRELGLCMDAPAHIFEYETELFNLPYALTNEVASSFSIKIWVNNNTLKNPAILSAGGVNINRAANYVQKWFRLDADEADSDTVIAGLVFGMNDEGAAEFKPWATLGTGTQYTSGPAIVSLQRSLWTRLQMLPFVISPFDGHATQGASVRDIYDIAYMFGLAGFRASDYRESVYNREKEVINQGYLFVSDPWVEASSITKAAAGSSGISIAKGYEIKKN